MSNKLRSSRNHFHVLFVYRHEDEVAVKTTFQKNLREVEGQLQELQEDLDTEKEARNKAEKQKRDLSEELEALKSELEDSLETSVAVQELRNKREMEVVHLKKQLEDEGKIKETHIQELRAKHAAASEQLNEQIDTAKRVSYCTFFSVR